MQSENQIKEAVIVFGNNECVITFRHDEGFILISDQSKNELTSYGLDYKIVKKTIRDLLDSQ